MELVLALGAEVGAALIGTAATAAEVLPAIGGWSTVVTTEVAASTAMSALQGVTTAASVLSSIGGGIAAFGESRLQAGLAEAEGRQGQIASEERALRLAREHVQKVGQSRVAFAAAGLDISSGTPAAIERGLDDQLAFETRLESLNAQQRRVAASMRAEQLRTRGVADLAGGIGKAVGSGAKYGIDIARRG